MALSLGTSSSFTSSLDWKTRRTPVEFPCAVALTSSRPSPRLRAEYCSSSHGIMAARIVTPPSLEAKEAAAAERLLHGSPGHHEREASGVPVYVMLPLDTVSPATGALSRPQALNASLLALRSAGVEGVMVDVWWGLAEKDGPLRYNWEAYVELVRMVQRHGLKLQMVMSFHQCGGNVGDSCSIPLPPWVLEEMSSDPDVFYTDRAGRRNPEYISLGCDSLPVLRGRTPIQAYSDYMVSFRERFKEYLGDVIVEIQVGMGPCGELRYPSYPESNGTWRYPGIGEFQCYDKYMMASLRASALAVGRKEWGEGGPHDAGYYNQFPEETGFFRREGTWNSDYGRFFLDWYSAMLLQHGDRVLAAAQAVFQGTGAKLSGKVAGIHWHYKTRSHAAELTAGYYNTRHRDGYLPLAKILARRGVVLNFTCMEMRDEQQPGHVNSSPELLVRQVKGAARAAGIELAGENALQRYDDSAFSQVLATARDDTGRALSAFTYLRMSKYLFDGENWRRLVDFVRSMSHGVKRARLPAPDSLGSELYVGFISSSNYKNKEGRSSNMATHL